MILFSHRSISILCCVFLAFVCLPCIAQGITGSRHDFSSTGWNWPFMHGDTNEICIPCHTPHNADPYDQDVQELLWNHQVTAATFTPYGSHSIDATINQPVGISKLCLSCHDGTVALDSWGGQNGQVFWPGGHRDVLTPDLTDDHPVSFAFDAALTTADGGLNDPLNTPSGLGGTIVEDMLEGGLVQCTSCHDPHDRQGNAKLLVRSNANSALCLTCHRK